MKKNAFTTTAAILLILYSLLNFGAAMGEFGKAKALSGSASFAASMGELAGDKAGAKRVESEGASASSVLYLIAVFILVTAVLDLVGAVGIFSCQPWAIPLVTVTAICGILVEIQDISEDGFGVGKLIFLAINIIALFSVQNARLSSDDAALVKNV